VLNFSIDTKKAAVQEAAEMQATSLVRRQAIDSFSRICSTRVGKGRSIRRLLAAHRTKAELIVEISVHCNIWPGVWTRMDEMLDGTAARYSEPEKHARARKGRNGVSIAVEESLAVS
jgi:hypothetical protein